MSSAAVNDRPPVAVGWRVLTTRLPDTAAAAADQADIERSQQELLPPKKVVTAEGTKWVRVANTPEGMLEILETLEGNMAVLYRVRGKAARRLQMLIDNAIRAYRSADDATLVPAKNTLLNVAEVARASVAWHRSLANYRRRQSCLLAQSYVYKYDVADGRELLLRRRPVHGRFLRTVYSWLLDAMDEEPAVELAAAPMRTAGAVEADGRPTSSYISTDTDLAPARVECELRWMRLCDTCASDLENIERVGADVRSFFGLWWQMVDNGQIVDPPPPPPRRPTPAELAKDAWFRDRME